MCCSMNEERASSGLRRRLNLTASWLSLAATSDLPSDVYLYLYLYRFPLAFP